MNTRSSHIIMEGHKEYKLGELKGSEIVYDFNEILTCLNAKGKLLFGSLSQEVIYKHKMPEIILKEQSQRFVYVLPKFVLSDNEKMLIELKELKGSRKVIMETTP